MLEKVLRFFITMVFAIVGALLARLLGPVLTNFISEEVLRMDTGFFQLTLASFLAIILGALVFGIVGFLLSDFVINTIKRFTYWVETQLNKMPIHDVLAGVLGLGIGLIIANLLGAAFSKIPIAGDYLPVAFSIVLGYLGIHITIKKRKEVEALFRLLPTHLPKNEKKIKEEVPISPKSRTVDRPSYKLLDTSVIIDGRIADICDTGFIDGTLLIPGFVLEELQHIADSADSLKRVRGRRGLDILQRIRSKSQMEVEITNKDFEDIIEVDSKLVRLAQEVHGKLITNDYNLNKVAELRGVKVLNINELANAVKPLVIPGETMKVSVVKEGKEYGQGVAYLDDGTMIVIENGRRYIGQAIEVEVTSALQTAAGRMIFAKPRTP